MKAITVHQPWATLLALGEKQYETRSWATGYRGLIAIHASKSTDDLLNFFNWTEFVKKHGYTDPFSFNTMAHKAIMKHYEPGFKLFGEIHPTGCILAVGELVAMHKGAPPELSYQERTFGNFGHGRVAWELANMRRLVTPIPARGQQGLWEWDQPDTLVFR